MSDKSKTKRGICVMQQAVKFIGQLKPFILMTVLTVFLAGCTKDENTDPSNNEMLSVAGINQVIPANLADSVEVNPVVSVTFKAGTKASVLSASTLTLKKGQTIVPGKTTISGTTAFFTPESDLKPETEYTAILKTGITSDSEGAEEDQDSESHEYTWKFKTGTHHHNSTMTVVSTDPADKTTAVPVSAQLSVTFNAELIPAMKNSNLIVVKNGQTVVEGSLSYSGANAIFKPSANLIPNTFYTVKVKLGTGSPDNIANSYNWSFTTGGDATDTKAPTVTGVTPANNGTGVVTGSTYIVTFSEPMNPSTINAATITLKQGTVAIAGTVTYSGTTATFTPAAALSANLVYTGTVTTGVKDVAGNSLAANYTSVFTTASVTTDVTAPTVISVTPANSATSVGTGTSLTVTFSEAMNATTLTSSTFTLKQGSTSVSGTVTASGTGATFAPSGALAAGTVFTATITTGAKDAAGNALAASYSWSFTTAVQADLTAPTVVSVTPVSNATSVAVNGKPSATFSEAMNSSTITSSTFTLKQGTTSVAGTVSYSGTTATFTPSAALTGNTVYTATVTTGAKDAAGNAIASNYTWTFTTVATVSLVSFATDVVPVLTLCNNCHTHPWTPSSNASTFYTNLVNQGFVNTASPTSSTMYTKLSGGHPGGTSISTTDKNKILNWFTEGAKNN